MPEPAITDDAVEAFFDAHGLGNVEATQQGLRDWQREKAAIRAGLAGAAPHIAAQALRAAAEDLRPAIEQAERDGNAAALGVRYAIQKLTERADAYAGRPGSSPTTRTEVAP